MAEEPKGEAKKAVRGKAQPAPHLSSIAREVVSPMEDGHTIREVRARVEEAFLALGTDQLPGTVIPAGSKNNSAEAAEYVLADLLEKIASERKKRAYEAAEKAGVFGSREDYVQGDTVMVFNDPNFSINVKCGKPTRMIGKEETLQALARHLGRKATEVFEECKKDRAPTKQIIVSMK